MSDGEPLVHLIDGHVWIFRSWFSMPSRTAPDGRETGAAYGFTSSLIKYLREHEPSHVGMCFDHAMTSFRNAIEPGYKADRGEPEPALEAQFALCREAAEALGVAVYEAPDFEADDVIATLADRLVPGGASVRVVTVDKDLAQLVTEDGRVVLYDNAKDATFDARGVREKFGVDPGQIPDYLGLVGDAVDCLPGVPGVGAKSAAAVLEAFETLDRIPSPGEPWSAVRVRGAARLAERIQTHRDRALRTRELATVRRDVPGVRSDLRTLAWRGAHPELAQTLFQQLGWERITTRVPRWIGNSAPDAPGKPLE
jgi:5'-3' exonuclease